LLVKKLLNILFLRKFNILLKILINFILNDFNKVNKSCINLNILILVFIFNVILNIINLLPFSFCLNSQLRIFFFFRFLIWLSCVFLSINKFIKRFFSHLTPIGCPLVLRPLIVLIEFIRLIIRPITLRVRISANILAGHLLIHLLTEFSFFLINLTYFSLIFSTLFLFILNLLEIGVAIVQPYIFCTLINIYLTENN
jgi:F-type H+-transporting ATPase subunit a